MTRRKFIQKLLKGCSIIFVGAWGLAKKASPRRFMRAVRLKNYPGSLRPLQDITKQGKWSG
ncbi:MAG: hypothetical protein ACYS0I_06390 [Planctomycetota bacterium]|jgi:hypothetical protein